MENKDNGNKSKYMYLVGSEMYDFADKLEEAGLIVRELGEMVNDLIVINETNPISQGTLGVISRDLKNLSCLLQVLITNVFVSRKMNKYVLQNGYDDEYIKADNTEEEGCD